MHGAAMHALCADQVYATMPRIFAVLSRLFAKSMDCTIAETMQELAAQGALGCVDLDELSSPPSWFGSRTVAAVLSGDAPPTRTLPGNSWLRIVSSARELLAQMVRARMPPSQSARHPRSRHATCPTHVIPAPDGGWCVFVCVRVRSCVGTAGDRASAGRSGLASATDGQASGRVC